MKINHVIALIKKNNDPKANVEILQMCPYEKLPTEEDYNKLIEIVSTNPEFGMIGLQIDRDFQIVKLKDEALKLAQEQGSLPLETTN